MNHQGCMAQTGFVLLTLSMLVACGKSQESGLREPASSENIIYGEDDRVEASEVSGEWSSIAKSTVALFKISDMSISFRGRATLKLQNLGARLQLCEGERFASQKAGSFCSGALIGPDLILTAGHCVQDVSDCSETRFVFDFKASSSGIVSSSVAADNLYSCKKIIRHVLTSDGADYAVIQLDRSVKSRQPLKMAEHSDLRTGDSIVVMGHPSGLPLKIAGGAEVRSIASEHFVTNLDTYGGNSGSPVFNARTHKIEGVLVRGGQDYVSNGFCRYSNVCTEGSCRGEDVTRIDQVVQALAQDSN